MRFAIISLYYRAQVTISSYNIKVYKYKSKKKEWLGLKGRGLKGDLGFEIPNLRFGPNLKLGKDSQLEIWGNSQVGKKIPNLRFAIISVYYRAQVTISSYNLRLQFLYSYIL